MSTYYSAGSCLILVAKLNDIKGPDLESLFKVIINYMCLVFNKVLEIILCLLCFCLLDQGQFMFGGNLITHAEEMQNAILFDPVIVWYQTYK